MRSRRANSKSLYSALQIPSALWYALVNGISFPLNLPSIPPWGGEAREVTVLLDGVRFKSLYETPNMG